MATKRDLPTLLAAVKELGEYKFENEVEKYEAMSAMRTASDKLQRTYDRLIEMWGAPPKDAAMMIGIEVGLWTKWKAAGGRQAVGKLAEMTGMELEFLSALLKHLAAWHIIEEEGPDEYSLTEFSDALTRPEIAGCVYMQVKGFLTTFAQLPVYAYQNGYKRATDHKWTPFSYAMGYPGSFFEYLANNKSAGTNFDLGMKGYSHGRGNFIDVFPTKQLLDGADPDTPIFVDVGGGMGHDIELLRKVHPSELEGRLVLQDQPHVIEKVNAPESGHNPGIKAMAHDFLAEQPIKGARAYYMHSILHDWNDESCKTILKGLKDAMKPGYSRILINEIIVPQTHASRSVTTFDLVMMSLVGGRERSEEQWRDLVGSVGLKIAKIWSNPVCIESIIEVDFAS